MTYKERRIKMTKAIFFDIDGTLVSFKTHKIPQETIHALHELRKKDIKLFIATGRHHSMITLDNIFTAAGIFSSTGTLIAMGILSLQFLRADELYRNSQVPIH